MGIEATDPLTGVRVFFDTETEPDQVIVSCVKCKTVFFVWPAARAEDADLSERTKSVCAVHAIVSGACGSGEFVF